MIKENKKLKDLTYDEYAKFKSFECGYYGKCDNCPFRTGNCENPDSPDSWFNNKEMYSEGFLEQVLPVDKELLDDEDRRHLTNIFNLINVRNKDIHSIRKLVGKSSGKKLGYIEIIFNSNVEDYGEERFLGPLFNPEKRFKELEDNKKYKIENLGLWRK